MTVRQIKKFNKKLNHKKYANMKKWQEQVFMSKYLRNKVGGFMVDQDRLERLFDSWAK